MQCGNGWRLAGYYWLCICIEMQLSLYSILTLLTILLLFLCASVMPSLCILGIL